jgi:hypothetical protein
MPEGKSHWDTFDGSSYSMCVYIRNEQQLPGTNSTSPSNIQTKKQSFVTHKLGFPLDDPFGFD